MKTILKILLPFAVLGLTAAAAWTLIRHRSMIQPEPVKEVIPLVEVVSARPGPHQFVVRSQGEVAARTEIDLVSEVPGKVVWIAPDFADGGFFKEKELLVKLDPRDYELAVTQAEAAVAQARVALEREMAEASIAKQEWEQIGKGQAKALLLREPQLAQAEASLRAALASLEKAKLDLTRCEITAPFAGRIRAKRVDVGQFINRGTPLARAYAVDYVEIALPIELDELDFLDLPMTPDADWPGLPVTLTARWGESDARWTGRLIRTGGDLNPVTRMLTGIVRVDDPYGLKHKDRPAPLPIGLFVNAAIAGRAVDSVYRVPRAALRGRDQLMVVDTEDRLRFRAVQVVRLLEKEALLRSGLESGDRVCVSLLDAPVDGMKVNPRELDSEPAAR